jgi:hypothetical protein
MVLPNFVDHIINCNLLSDDLISDLASCSYLGKSFAPPQYFANLIFKIKWFPCKHVPVFNRNMNKPNKFLLKLRAYHSVAGSCCKIQVHEYCSVTLDGIQMYRGIVQNKRCDTFLRDESLIKKHCSQPDVST